MIVRWRVVTMVEYWVVKVDGSGSSGYGDMSDETGLIVAAASGHLGGFVWRWVDLVLD